MATHTVKLLRREEVAGGTMSFYLEKPANFQFKPGQYLDCSLMDPPETDAEGNIRTFSVASAPAEKDLMVATRMRDTAFKRVLKTMPLGTHLKIDGPLGSFTLHSNATRPAVFLAGGIGITPFRSMMVNAAHEGLARPVVLFYLNRRPEDSAFLEEVQQIGSANKNCQTICVMTKMEKSKQSWHGATGYLDKAMLARFVPDLSAPIYYAAGPPAFVTAMKGTLIGASVNEDDIRSEDFAGY
jgi:ferredoxin-NADP reductase